MNNNKEKLVNLSMISLQIAIYEEIIDLLGTQMGYYKKKMQDAQIELSQQHDDFIASPADDNTPIERMLK